jgi:hypothetical protein
VSSENRMAKTTKLPRLTETSDGGCVEIADGISLAWSRKGDLWSIAIKSPGGLDIRDTRRDAVESPRLH